MGANDVAAIVHTSGRADAAQEFTSNPRLLLSAIDKFMGRKLRSSLLKRIEEEARTRGSATPTSASTIPTPPSAAINARNTLDSLKSFADLMAGVRGRRKALVYFSEGIDYDINDVVQQPRRDDASWTPAATPSPPRRAPTSRSTASTCAGSAPASTTRSRFSRFPTIRRSVSTSSALHDEVRLGQDSLRVLSDETGGFATVNTNDIAGAFRRLVDENSSYYVLGYYPANDRARRPLPQDRGAGQQARADRAGAARLRGAARPCAGNQARRPERRVGRTARGDEQSGAGRAACRWRPPPACSKGRTTRARWSFRR